MWLRGSDYFQLYNNIKKFTSSLLWYFRMHFYVQILLKTENKKPFSLGCCCFAVTPDVQITIYDSHSMWFVYILNAPHFGLWSTIYFGLVWFLFELNTYMWCHNDRLIDWSIHYIKVLSIYWISFWIIIYEYQHIESNVFSIQKQYWKMEMTPRDRNVVIVIQKKNQTHVTDTFYRSRRGKNVILPCFRVNFIHMMW